jgi:hypothetical protein
MRALTPRERFIAEYFRARLRMMWEREVLESQLELARIRLEAARRSADFWEAELVEWKLLSLGVRNEMQRKAQTTPPDAA